MVFLFQAVFEVQASERNEFRRGSTNRVETQTRRTGTPD